MRFRHAHRIATDVEKFWDVFFDPEFNRALYLRGLEFASYRIVVDKTDRDGTRLRRVECVPNVELPAVAHKYFGETVRFTEVGQFDPHSNHYYTQVVLGFGGDKLTLTGDVCVQPDGPCQLKRVVTGNLTVKVGRIAKLVERVAKQQMQDSCERSAEFTSRWIRESEPVRRYGAAL
jgi:hypothetical protein